MTADTTASHSAPFSAARYIKEIGRGVKGARPLPRADVETLFEAMLQGRVSDIELGAILMAYRIKGETPEELAGMLDAAHRHCAPLAPVAGRRVVVIPSYNGARKQPNLVPLLALLLQRAGLPVLVHGVRHFMGRITSLELFDALGLPPSPSAAAASESLAQTGLAVLAIDTLSPALDSLLARREVIGLRNSTHTLVKMLQPVGNHGPEAALQLVSYTHPEYRETLSAFFAARPANVLLTRGTEGEAVADARRAGRIDHLCDGRNTLLASGADGSVAAVPALPSGTDLQATVAHIRAVLAGEEPVPEPLAQQVEAIRQAAA